MDLLDNYLETLPLASSHWKIPTLSIVYLLIVNFIGPQYMSRREIPRKTLRKIIPLYNIIQVFCNAIIIIFAVQDMHFIRFSLNNLCGNNEPTLETQRKFITIGYFWCMLKVSDFLDTIFFILQKKDSHVSFLHVYHHSTTMIVAFVVFRYIRIEQSIIYAAVNCIVHMVMYLYYFQTSLGYRPRWKKVVTILQLSQFFFLMIMTLCLFNCQEKAHYFYFSVYSISQCVMYLYLFGRFFYNEYSKKVQNREMLEKHFTKIE